MSDWRGIIQAFYPKLLQQTYCVPPVHFNQVPYKRQSIAGQSFLLTQPLLNTDTRGSAKPLACQISHSKRKKRGAKSNKAVASRAPPAVLVKDHSSSEVSVSTSYPLESTERHPSESTERHRSESTEPQPSESTERHPSESTERYPSESTERHPSKSTEGHPSESTERHPSDSTGRHPSESTEPHPSESTEPHPSESTEPHPSDSTERHRSESTEPQPSESTERHPSESTEPHPSDSTERHPSESTEPHPSDSTERHRSESTEPHPSDFTDPTPVSPYSMWTRESGSVAQTSVVFESDTREDRAQQQVLHCLQTLGEEQEEVMFIVSRMNFADVLNKPCYAAAVKDLPKPFDLPEGYRRGDCDILLIHRHHGILVGEVKSVGMKAAVLEKTPHEMDNDVAKRIRKAAEQLDKSEKVIKHVVKDIAAGVSVMKTVILPYVSRTQLQNILQADAELGELLCRSIGADDRETAVKFCICREQLSHAETPWDVTPTVLSELSAWLQHRMKMTSDTSMSDDVYIDIVARVAGPATSITVHCIFSPRVEVRTLDQAISECGERLSQLVLTPPQLCLLQRKPKIVCLTGPPGTGKSLLLVIMGLIWLRKGFDVHVVSVRSVNLAASCLICHQLRMTIRSDPRPPARVGKVHLHEFHVDETEAEVENMVGTLVAAAGAGGKLHVLMDEILLGDSLLPSALGSRVYRILKDLCTRIQDLHLWAASMFRVTVCEDVHVEQLTEPLRCSPVVLREVLPGVESSWYSAKVHGYTTSSTPSPFDGPKIIRLSHKGEGHIGRWPVGCFKCGSDVGDLLHHLNIGKTAAGSKATSCPVGEGCTGCSTTSPPSLQYRDVFVLTRSSELRDGDNTGKEHDGVSENAPQASAFVRGLRSARVPVCVIGREDLKAEWERKVSEMSVALKDQVTVTHFSAVLGMERKVVVYFPGRKYSALEEQTEDQIDAADRILAMSRCTGQLIVIDVPHNACDTD